MSEDGGLEAEKTRAEKLDAAKKKLKKLQAQKKGRVHSENVVINKESTLDVSSETSGEIPGNVFKSDDDGGAQILETSRISAEEAIRKDVSLLSGGKDSQVYAAESQEKLPNSEELKHIRDALQAAEETNLQSTKSLIELQSRFENVEKENSRLQSECSRLEALCKRVQGDSQTESALLRKQISDREAQADSLQARISSLTSEKEQLKNENSALVAEKTKLDNAAESNQAKSEAAEREYSTLREQYTQLQTGSEQSQRDLHSLNSQIKDLSEENAALKSSIVVLEAALTSTKAIVGKHESQEKQFEDKIKDIGSRSGNLQKENRDMILQLTELRQKIVELTDDKAEITGRLRTLERKESDMKKSLQEKSEELEILRQKSGQQEKNHESDVSIQNAGQQKLSEARSPRPDGMEDSLLSQKTDEADTDAKAQSRRHASSHSSRIEEEQAQHEETIASLTEQHYRDLSAARAQIRNLESEMSKHQREAQNTRSEMELRNKSKDVYSPLGTEGNLTESDVPSMDKGQTGYRMIPSPFVHLDITGFIPEDTIRIREANLARLRRLKQDEPSQDLLHRANAGVGTAKVL